MKIKAENPSQPSNISAPQRELAERAAVYFSNLAIAIRRRIEDQRRAFTPAEIAFFAWAADTEMDVRKDPRRKPVAEFIALA